jgi:hypothetical protein
VACYCCRKALLVAMITSTYIYCYHLPLVNEQTSTSTAHNPAFSFNKLPHLQHASPSPARSGLFSKIYRPRHSEMQRCLTTNSQRRSFHVFPGRLHLSTQAPEIINISIGLRYNNHKKLLPHNSGQN